MLDVRLIEQLSAVSGEESVLPADTLADFAIEGFVPRAAIAPDSIEQVQRLVLFAEEQDLALVPWGGGTAMHLGNTPRRYDIALVLTRLNRVLEYEPADLTVGVQAGIRLADLQRHLARAGQFLPLDPPFAEQATIGGILATAASGPLRYAYGAPRDLMIGIGVIQADGALTQAGGRVVKNVTGYDMGKLHIGALGTLGIIVKAHFKVVPLPATERTLLIASRTVTDAVSLAFALDRANLGLRALTVLNKEAAAAIGEERPLVAVRVGGEAAAVDAVIARVYQLALETGATAREIPDAEETVWEPMRRLGVSRGEVGTRLLAPYLTARASLLPTAVTPFIEALETCLPTTRPAITAIVPLGNLTATWHVSNPQQALELATGLFQIGQQQGAQVWLEAAPRSVKEQVDIWGPLPEAFPLMRHLKAQFDPKGRLNPGRYVGRL